MSRWLSGFGRYFIPLPVPANFLSRTSSLSSAVKQLHGCGFQIVCLGFLILPRNNWLSKHEHRRWRDLSNCVSKLRASLTNYYSIDSELIVHCLAATSRDVMSSVSTGQKKKHAIYSSGRTQRVQVDGVFFLPLVYSKWSSPRVYTGSRFIYTLYQYLVSKFNWC